MKKSIGAIILVLIFLFPGLLSATNVGGIINSDTIWELKDSPFTITSEIQIADGVTLTINPGVVINGFGNIRVWGILNAIGTDSLNITFNEVRIYIGDNATNGLVNIQFANFISGNFAFTGPSGLGNSTLTLLDSILDNASVTCINPTGDSHIERNIFVNTKSNLFGTSWPNANVYIRNNFFYQWRDEFAVQLANYSGISNSKIIFEYNSFLTIDKTALTSPPVPPVELPGYTFNPEMIVANNYWGTTDTNIINSMIYDRNDDLNYYTYFRYIPFLTEPHPDTPSLFKEPIADFIANPRSGINHLTVNFWNQSTGDYNSNSWNFGDGATSKDQNPSHTYTNSGIFTVSLTVIGPGGSDIETKADYITIEESKAMPWIPLLLLDD